MHSQAYANIRGWLTADEACCLWEWANSVPHHKCIVELGAYRGRSTVILAETGVQVYTVDPMVVGSNMGDEQNPAYISDADVLALAEVVSKYLPTLRWFRDYSTNVSLSCIREDIGMLFIDAVHTGLNPLNDFLHYEQLLKPGSLVAFHDYSFKWRAVRDTVHQLLFHQQLSEVVEVEDSLIVCRK